MFTKLRQLDSLKYEFHHAGKTSDCHGAAEIPIQFTWVFLKLSTDVRDHIKITHFCAKPPNLHQIG